MNKEKSCGAIVYNDDKVLLIKHNAGHIAFPKGHVEGNETEEETAYREILEETGLETKIDNRFRYVISYSPKPLIMKDVVYFTATVTGGKEKPQLEEVSEVMWMPMDRAMEMVTFDNDKKVLANALKYINRK